MSTPLRRAGGGMLAAVMLGGLAVITPALTSVSLAAAPTVRQGAGTGDAVTVALDQFRADLGGGKTAGANGSFGGVRREINWDGVPDQFASPNDLPLDFFNTRSPRGAVFSTPGVSVLVSAKASVGKPRFGELNPTYAAEFSAFSPERIFTAVGSTVTEVSFFVPGTTTKGAVRGFGVMFTDVDSPESTKIELLDAAGTTVAVAKAPAAPGNGLFSFVGVSVDSPVVSKVRITSGGLILGDGTPDAAFASRDKVSMDDFVYSEPVALPAAAAAVAATTTAAPATTAAVVTTNAPVTTAKPAVTTKKRTTTKKRR